MMILSAPVAKLKNAGALLRYSELAETAKWLGIACRVHLWRYCIPARVESLDAMRGERPAPHVLMRFSCEGRRTRSIFRVKVSSTRRRENGYMTRQPSMARRIEILRPKMSVIFCASRPKICCFGIRDVNNEPKDDAMLTVETLKSVLCRAGEIIAIGRAARAEIGPCYS